MQPSLFTQLPIEGLDYRADFIAPEEEAGFIGHLEALELTPFRFQSWVGKRQTRSFGWRHDFEDASFRKGDELPDWLIPLRDRVAAMVQVAPDDFCHCLVARYDPGAGIGWHRDRPVYGLVAGISLGAEAVLRFRQRTSTGFRRARLTVERRSAYLLAGEARSDWEHSIAPGGSVRFSITFRTLSAAGRRKAEAQRSS